MAVPKKHYINQKEFFNEIIISKEKDELTKRAVELFQILAEKVSNAMSYKNPDDKDDVIAFAIHDLVYYWRNFNPEKNVNAFGYFTQIALNGMAKGWKKLYNEIDKRKLYISTEEGDVFNI